MMPSTNGHGPKRAILYARVSTDEQATKGYSVRQQLERGDSGAPKKVTRYWRRSWTRARAGRRWSVPA
jgi:hypothetical protein